MAERVDRMSADDGPLVLIYLDGDGTVRTAGTPGLRQDILKITSDAVCKYMEDNFAPSTRTKSNEDMFKAEDLRLDLIDPEALAEIRNGLWTCKQLRDFVRNMVLPKTAFTGKRSFVSACLILLIN